MDRRSEVPLARCRICKRPLTDPESVARLVGPECWSRYGVDPQLRLQGLEPEGEDHEANRQGPTSRPVRSKASPAPRFQVVAEDLDSCPDRVVDGSPMVVVDFDAARRWPCWRRLWTWVRRVMG